RRLELRVSRLRAVRLLARLLVEARLLEDRIRQLYVAGHDGPDELRERLPSTVRAMCRRFRVGNAPWIVAAEGHACMDHRRSDKERRQRGAQPTRASHHQDYIAP